MTERDPHEDDRALRARLAAADPASSLPAAGAERTVRLLEDAMAHDPQAHDPQADDAGRDDRATGTRDRHPLTWLLAGAAALVIAGAVLLTVLVGADEDDAPLAGRDATPTVGPSTPADPDPGTGSGAPDPDGSQVTALSVAPVPQGRCAVPTPAVLAGKEIAFEGVASRVGDRTVTLETDRVFAGTPADVVTLESAAGTGALLETIRFTEGDRYLVSASDGQVALCGLSGPSTDELRGLYQEAFGG